MEERKIKFFDLFRISVMSTRCKRLHLNRFSRVAGAVIRLTSIDQVYNAQTLICYRVTTTTTTTAISAPPKSNQCDYLERKVGPLSKQKGFSFIFSTSYEKKFFFFLLVCFHFCLSVCCCYKKKVDRFLSNWTIYTEYEIERVY